MNSRCSCSVSSWIMAELQEPWILFNSPVRWRRRWICAEIRRANIYYSNIFAQCAAKHLLFWEIVVSWLQKNKWCPRLPISRGILTLPIPPTLSPICPLANIGRQADPIRESSLISLQYLKFTGQQERIRSLYFPFSLKLSPVHVSIHVFWPCERDCHQREREITGEWRECVESAARCRPRRILRSLERMIFDLWSLIYRTLPICTSGHLEGVAHYFCGNRTGLLLSAFLPVPLIHRGLAIRY